MASANPKGARAWLKSHIAANREGIEHYLTNGADILEETLEDVFPYTGGALPPKLDGIASIILLEWAETDDAALRYLRRIMAGLVRSGEPVPSVWRKLHANILDGTLLVQPSKGRRPLNERRNKLISDLVSELQRRFKVARLANRLNRKGDSALEIIVDELKGLCPSLSTVELDSIETAIIRKQNTELSDPIIGVLKRLT